LVPRLPYTPCIGHDTKTAILLDTETTGLDTQKNEIIEVGMVKFDYFADGRIAGVRDTFSAFNEPSEPIPPEVAALTGITDDMPISGAWGHTPLFRSRNGIRLASSSWNARRRS
jgi:DNA polymerase-3 subunit epsilon